MEDIGDGYRSHEPRRPRLREVMGRMDSETIYPAWGVAAVKAAREERRRIQGWLYAIRDRRDLLRDASFAASRYRWETRDAYDKAAANQAVPDEEVEILSNTAWWAEQDYLRADRAYNALFDAYTRMRDRLTDFDARDKHEHVIVPAHWHGPHCQTCKDASLVLQALEERGPR